MKTLLSFAFFLLVVVFFTAATIDKDHGLVRVSWSIAEPQDSSSNEMQQRITELSASGWSISHPCLFLQLSVKNLSPFALGTSDAQVPLGLPRRMGCVQGQAQAR